MPLARAVPGPGLRRRMEEEALQRPPATLNCRPPNRCRPGRPPPPPRRLPLPALPAGRDPDAPPDGPHGAATAAQADHAAAPGTPPARGTGPTRAQSASPGQPPGAPAAATESGEGVLYRAHTRPSHTHVSPSKAVPARGRLPRREATGRSRPGAQTHADGHHAAAAATSRGPSGTLGDCVARRSRRGPPRRG